MPSLQPGAMVLALLDPDQLVTAGLQLAIDAGGHAFFLTRAPSVNASVVATMKAGMVMPHR